jgi:hypothetical protein
MLTCFAAALLCLTVSGDPLDVPAMTTSGEFLDVGVHVTSTEFRARNYSQYPQVFLFRMSGTTLVTYYTLPAGSLMSFAYAEDALDGVEMEVVSRQGALLLHTGAVSLDAVHELDSQILWIQRTSSNSRTWEQVGDGVSLVEAGGSFLPSALQQCLMAGTELPPDPTAVHVPVITPGSNPPPDLDDDPLPPV